jgi:hypothetical protein
MSEKKFIGYLCAMILAAAVAGSVRRHEYKTTNQFLLTFAGVGLLCNIEKRKDKVTDRQHRARARKCIDKKLPKHCAFCGRGRNMRVHHLNGNEADDDPKNLIWACHACNTSIGFLLKRHNIGRRVDLEYNPPAQPARSLAQWMMAVKSLHGQSNELTPRQAIAMIRATSQNRRSQFADDIWKIRRAKGTDRTAVPF